MGHRRKLTNHQKQLRFFAILFGGFMIVCVVVVLIFFNKQPSVGH